jgi:hypothetical protein
MRKQYHFRPTPDGVLVWDIDRLVALSAGFPSRPVPLTAIRELDEPFWFSSSGAEATCRAITDHARLIQAADISFPIILSSDGRIMDGMHRVAKALMLGHQTIEAVQFRTDPEPDFRNVRPEDLPYDEEEP